MAATPRRRWWLVVVSCVLLVAACGGPETVSPSDLVFEQRDYDGEVITTRGLVVEFDEDDGALERHVVVQDAEQNRVELQPLEAAEPYAGSIVEVRGEFSFDPEVGRILHVEEIEPLTGD